MKNIYNGGNMNAKTSTVDTGLIDRLNKVIKESAGKKYTFAQQLGVDPSMITRYLSGDNAPKTEFLLKICKTYGYNIYWLAKGEGPVKGTSPDEYKRLQSQCSKLAKENEELRKTVNNLNDMLELYKTKHKGK